MCVPQLEYKNQEQTQLRALKVTVQITSCDKNSTTIFIVGFFKKNANEIIVKLKHLRFK